MNETKNSKFYILLPVLLAVTLAIGILTGASVSDSGGGKGKMLQGLEKFREILTYIERDYVDEVDSEKLVEGAINKTLSELDPHSVYIPASEAKLAKSQLEGEFDGIGVEFNIVKDTIYVVAPISGGPSEKVGIQAGDKIVTVNDSIVAGKGITNKDVFTLLRGKKGSTVKLGVKRSKQSELLDFEVTRDRIPQYSVDVSYMVNREVGYIKVSRFSAHTFDEFKQALLKLEEKGMKKLILDLQGNPGGYMDRAINMADEFIPGNSMIVYTDGKQDRYDSEARAYRKGSFEEGPLIILIDEGSASASEIVSGAIQDNDRGLIVGRRSFGKGLVQMPIDLKDGSELRLTISRYYTPSGRSIQKSYGDQNDYELDIIHRYEHGELFNSDSIKFIDSLKYETTKGRIVYGGGGIMPDHFVPLDTVKNSSYLNKLFTSNALREYALTYYETNKARLGKMDYERYRNRFDVTETMLKELVSLAEQSGVPFDEEGFKRSKPLIKNYTKAFIARSVWSNEGYYPILNEQNEIFQKAMTLFDEAARLASRE